MSRFFFLAVLAVLGAQVATSAQASTVTYDLVLTPGNAGGPAGTGVLTIDTTIPSTGTDVLTQLNGLQSLSFQIDGQTFDLSDAQTLPYVTFNNGSLINIAYNGAETFGLLNLDSAGLSYSYLDVLTGTTSTGAISDPPAAPLPDTIGLFASGLLVLGFFACRRNGNRLLKPKFA